MKFMFMAANPSEKQAEENNSEFVEIHSAMMMNSEEEVINIPEMDVQPDSDVNNGESWFNHSAKLFPIKPTVAREWISQRREGLKPWREFAKTDKFKLPTGVASVGRRLVRNVEHFQSNYLCVFIVLVIYCILTSPMLLFALAALFGMLYVIKVRNYQKKLSIGGRELSPAYQYALVGAVSFPLFYLAGAGSVIFWVIGASIFLIVAHAVFYASDPQPGAGFIDEQV